MIIASRHWKPQVKERDEKLRRLQATIGRLRDDFGYNLKLVEERDVELAAAEEAVRCLEDRLRDSDLRKTRTHQGCGRPK